MNRLDVDGCIPPLSINTYVKGFTCVQFACSPTKRNGVAEATPLQGGWRTVVVSLGSCHGFGSLLGTHPCNDTEADLVDHVSDVVEDSHDFS